MRADPATDCSSAEWWFMAVLASVGVFVACVLAPIALVRQTARKHASSERVQRSRVALLTNTYQDKFHYWEAVRCVPPLYSSTTDSSPYPSPHPHPNQVDLTRKLLLTSVVLLVGPDTVLQLWFVTATGLVFLVLFLALSPYRDEAAGRIQLAALVQLEFTYVAAAPISPKALTLILILSPILTPTLALTRTTRRAFNSNP